MGVINFNKANCKNCYKCVRYCPVKAIKVEDHQAQIVEDLCIGCGTCFRVCPQNAKQVASDVDTIREWLDSGEQVAVSLAPSFPGSFIMENPLQLITALRSLGFSAIEETAIGAEAVSKKYREDYFGPSRHIITTSCPTVDTLVEKYYSKLVPYLSTVVSPMMAHGKFLKEKYPGAKVVFAGPCISKKLEVLGQDGKPCIDAVLTFDEMDEWFEEKGINLGACAPGQFDSDDCDVARFYPLAGGVAKSSVSDVTGPRRVIKIDGLKNCRDFLDHIDSLHENYWIEMNACSEGCVNGPGNTHSPFVKYERIERVKEYISGNKRGEYSEEKAAKAQGKTYLPKQKDLFDAVPESAIEEILRKTGKFKPSDELNCGSCGYDSCREKAAAVYCGMAELDMCLPYMRNRNEAISNLIIQSTPNAIAVLDESFHILEFNPAAERTFEISRAEVVGKVFDKIFNYSPFIKLKNQDSNSYAGRGYYAYGDIHFMEILTYLPSQNMYLGIFVDISKEIKKENAYRQMQVDTLDMAQKVIDKQMRVSHQIAELLGETTAETKVTLTKLQKIVAVEDGGVE